MPERFLMPSLNEVAKTVSQSIQEAKTWKIESDTNLDKKATLKRIA